MREGRGPSCSPPCQDRADISIAWHHMKCAILMVMHKPLTCVRKLIEIGLQLRCNKVLVT